MAAFPATPQRPLPGAFFMTPAASRFQPTRQPSFQPGTAPVREANAPAALAPVQRAARTINDVLQREFSFPDLDSYVRQGISSDYDIPNGTSERAWAPFQVTQMHDFPDQILGQYNRAEVSTSMGLFAEINHAWVCIDNCMYMWDYTNPHPEIIGFEDQPNNITCVKLVVPRAGVFVADVTHLIAVATTQEIVLLGVNSTLQPSGVMAVTLYATGMSLQIRGINVQHIEGSAASGRIFFCGAENTSVYEFTYQQEEKWFAGRTGKINHMTPGYSALMPAIWSGKQQEKITQMVVDDSRRLLYTLSTDSTIRTFYMDSPTTLAQAIEKKRSDTLRDISHMISQSPLLTNSMRIVTISPISAKEGSKLHLMATTSSGCRLFLSATRGYTGIYGSAQGAPQSMQVQHIKFPPRIEPRPTTSTQTQPYGNAEPATDTGSLALAFTSKGFRYPPGLFFCFVQKQENNQRAPGDSVFLSGPDTGRISAQARDITAQASKYFEQACWIPLGSHMEAIGLVTKPFAAANQPIGFGNELAVQYDEAPQEVALMTNTGVHIIRRRRLVDIFAAAIRHGGDEGLESEIKKFIRLYGRAETTATALAVACGQGSDVTPGDPRIARISNPETLDAARKCFIEYGGRPSLNENLVSEGLSQAVDNVRPSSRHEGLALYMARLVRSLWKASVITTNTVPGGSQIKSTISLAKLNAVQADLVKLREFLKNNKSFIEGLSGPESLQRVTSQQEEIALQGEHQALYSLQKLNLNIIEGISFVQVLFEERVDQIWATLPDSVKQNLQSLTYEGLFASDQGKDLAKIMVKAIVNRNIASGSNVDTVAEALKRRCGTFCSADDVIIFKAQEQLKKASEAGPTTDMGRKLLNESLKLFIQVAGALSFDNLSSAVIQFTDLQFYAGAITLALLVAHESDRGNRALAWVNENKPADDTRAPLYGFRKQCYDLIHEVLINVDTAANLEPEMIDGKYTIIATKRNEARDVVNQSDDELFQYDLYEWYLNQGWERALLNVDSPYVVPFLTKSAARDVNRADLLWKYHTNHENLYEAASVQLELAKSDFNINLARRMHYLSMAKTNSSALSGQITGIGRQARQVLQYEISELLDVANIQDEILHRVRGMPLADNVRDSILGELDGQVLNISILYNKFADQAGFFDICLIIYESAAHRNAADIQSTWQQLLDSTHTKVADNPAAGQLPYEAVITMVKEMANRLNLSESTFSPHMVIPLLERYAQEFQFNVGPRTWLPDLFVNVGWAFEVVISVLQGMWWESVPPFVDRRRRVLAEHIVRVLEAWFEDCMRSNEILFGSVEVQDGVAELLDQLAQPGNLEGEEMARCTELRRKIARILR